MAYVYFKDLTRRTILRDKAFEIVKNPKYDGYQRGLALMVCKCFGKKKTSGSSIKNKITSSKELAEELHKQIIRKFKKDKSTLIFYRQYFGCWSYGYAITKQI